jgi:hypothetical protein
MFLPAQNLRSNIATWSVATARLPAVAHFLLDVLPSEDFDPDFRGQRIETTYFDTRAFTLRKIRLNKDRYLTLRIRCYQPPGGGRGGVTPPLLYAVSAKTESQKFRKELPSPDAERYLEPGASGRGEVTSPPGGRGEVTSPLLAELPADLQARALELLGDNPLVAVVKVCCRRCAVEDETDRYTLDVAVETDRGKCLPANVLEYKSTDARSSPPGRLLALGLRPVKLSKFLWATEW